ncbi:hypothetical protein [Variovorax sp. E3]|uniref:hypothetical protein n=1 Tax=Variovorax sp. E3 TaxID=1914993 RepID=UPI0018DDD20C|nr:hypothetical protein [Variovorax sp. E3]
MTITKTFEIASHRSRLSGSPFCIACAFFFAILLSACDGSEVTCDSTVKNVERSGNFSFRNCKVSGKLIYDHSYLSISHKGEMVAVPDSNGSFSRVVAQLPSPGSSWIVQANGYFYLLSETTEKLLTRLWTSEQGAPQSAYIQQIDADRWYIPNKKFVDIQTPDGIAMQQSAAGRVFNGRTLQQEWLPPEPPPDESFRRFDEVVSVSPDNSTVVWVYRSDVVRFMVADKNGPTMPVVEMSGAWFDAPSERDEWAPWFGSLTNWHRQPEGRWTIELKAEDSLPKVTQEKLAQIAQSYTPTALALKGVKTKRRFRAGESLEKNLIRSPNGNLFLKGNTDSPLDSGNAIWADVFLNPKLWTFGADGAWHRTLEKPSITMTVVKRTAQPVVDDPVSAAWLDWMDTLVRKGDDGLWYFRGSSKPIEESDRLAARWVKDFARWHREPSGQWTNDQTHETAKPPSQADPKWIKDLAQWHRGPDDQWTRDQAHETAKLPSQGKP